MDARGICPIGGVATMVMLQRDDTIEAIKRLDVLREDAVVHGDEEWLGRIRRGQNINS